MIFLVYSYNICQKVVCIEWNLNFVIMIWQNVKDKLPKKGQEVVIRYKGYCNLAIFNETESAFIVNVGADIQIRAKEIFWIEFNKPAKKVKKVRSTVTEGDATQ